MKGILFFLGASLLLAGCSGLSSPTPTPGPTFTPRPPTGTATVTRTSTLTPTFTASPLPTSTRVAQGPDYVIVPILLYHHIDISPVGSRYYVPPAVFEGQMKLLRDWGYETITIQMLVRAIQEGALLPPRPVILTFDDGNLDNFTNALPILQKYGFTGVEYAVYNYVGVDNYMSADQIKELAAAGWEIGSHSLSHLDLTLLEPAHQRNEIVESREMLEKTLGVPILTFSYPFGASNSGIIDFVHFAKYVAGVGLGYTADQGSSNLFTLQRREIYGYLDVKGFAAFLPWQGDPAFLPTPTPLPTPKPSRTPLPTYTQYPTRTPAP